MRKLFLIILIILPTMAAADQSLINRKAPDFSLYDQHDQLFTLQNFSGRPVILVACDKKASEQNQVWRTTIQKKYEGRVRTVGVADLRETLSILSGFIRKKFKKDTVSILLDWDGRLFTSYSLAKNVPNIIVIDDTGLVRYQYSGTATPEAVELLFSTVENILKKGT